MDEIVIISTSIAQSHTELLATLRATQVIGPAELEAKVTRLWNAITQYRKLLQEPTPRSLSIESHQSLWEYDRADLTPLMVEPMQCQGCIEDQPNQMAHMYEGGCLSYNERPEYSIESYEVYEGSDTAKPQYPPLPSSVIE